MTTKPAGDRFSLARWSRRKLASALDAAAPPAPAPAVAAPPAAGAPSVELPPLESLTFDSDFTAFLKAGVDPTVKRAALKKLLHDPRFNVMDGLDVYIDDYTKADPIPPDMLSELMQRFERSGAPSTTGDTAGEERAEARAPAAVGEETTPAPLGEGHPPSDPKSTPRDQEQAQPDKGPAQPGIALADRDPSAASTDAPKSSQRVGTDPMPARDPIRVRGDSSVR